VTTAVEMLRATRAAAARADLVFFAAAPADWRPAVRRRGKIKKGGGAPRSLRLVENPDIARTLGRRKGRRVHVGFALEVQRPYMHAMAKMAAKRFDAVVLNGPQNVGRGGGAAWWLALALPRMRGPGRRPRG
jgi:phosphopantothenoylcysteine decarboxylase/phosphopantothenate--cysteine ligase